RGQLCDGVVKGWVAKGRGQRAEGKGQRAEGKGANVDEVAEVWFRSYSGRRCGAADVSVCGAAAGLQLPQSDGDGARRHPVGNRHHGPGRGISAAAPRVLPDT